MKIIGNNVTWQDCVSKSIFLERALHAHIWWRRSKSNMIAVTCMQPSTCSTD